MNNEYTVFWLTWYNLEEELHRKCIESVLNQTNPNLLLVIRDNGSTDGSGELIKEYAMKDDRILFYRNEVGYQLDEDERKAQEIIYDRVFSDERIVYSAMIDHDDFYTEDFLEKAIEKQKRTKADMVCVATGFYDKESKKVTGVRTIDENTYIEDQKIINGQFEDVYKFVRTNWGKLYTMETYKKILEISKNQPRNVNGPSDTYVNLNLFKQIDKIAFLQEPLHFYVTVNNSHYRGLQSDDHIRAFKVVYDLGKELAAHYGCDTPQVDDFLKRIYASSMNDIVRNVVRNEDLDLNGKTNKIRFMLEQPLFSEVVLNDMQPLNEWFEYLSSRARQKEVSSEFCVLQNDREEFEKLLQEYVYFAENEEYEAANYYLNALLIWKPYVRDFIYYKIFLCYKLGNMMEYAMFVAYGIEVLAGDMELVSLIRDINSEWRK